MYKTKLSCIQDLTQSSNQLSNQSSSCQWLKDLRLDTRNNSAQITPETLGNRNINFVLDTVIILDAKNPETF